MSTVIGTALGGMKPLCVTGHAGVIGQYLANAIVSDKSK